MEIRYCDDRGGNGFGWIVDESMTRTSHALAADGKVWLVDALDWPAAVERALGLGEPAGVIQLLDRHDRHCAKLAARLSVPHHVTPDEVPGSPFTFIPVLRRKRWRESAIWWPETRTLVVAEALGSNAFFAAGERSARRAPAPPAHAASVLGDLEPEHVLVGHGEGARGERASRAVRDALRTSRRGLPGVVVRLPFAGRR